MVAFVSKKNKTHTSHTIVPQKLKEFCARRFGEALGVSVVAVSLFFLLALYGYSSRDPNINYINENVIQNPLGYYGASVADFLIQFFGLGAFCLVGIIIYFGLSMIVREKEFPNFLRLLSGLSIIIMFCGVLTHFFGVNSDVFLTSHGGYAGVVLVGIFESQLVIDIQFLFGLFYVIIFMLLVSYTFKIKMVSIFAVIQLCGISLFAFSILVLSLPIKLIKYMCVYFLPFYSQVNIFQKCITMLRSSLETLNNYFLNKKNSKSSQRFSFAKTQDNTLSTKDALDNQSDSMSSNVKENSPFSYLQGQLPYSEDTDRDISHVKVQIPNVENEKTLNVSIKPGDCGDFMMPSINLLRQTPSSQYGTPADREKIVENVSKLEKVLRDFGVSGDIVEVRSGPVVTLYELEPSPGVKSSRVIGLSDDIARSMSAISTRVAVVSGKNAIGIELPNDDRQTVYLRELIANRNFSDNVAQLPLALGRDIAGEPVIADLSRMPHLLIAGTTGSGKSVGINTMLLSLIYALPPQECRLILIDPKMLELSIYDDIPHLLTPVVTEPKKAVVALKWVVREMERRYRLMSQYSVRNLHGYNARAEQHNLQIKEQQEAHKETQEAMEKLPYIVLVIDEMADLMMVAGKEIEAAVQRLAQMARAAGIHMITATQRPSVDVITGTIKANFPTRISFQVSSKIDSRTILGEQGAEQLLGQGDMLFMESGGRIRRVHGPFVSDSEVEGIVTELKKQKKPEYLDDVLVENDDSHHDSVFDAILNNQLAGNGDNSDLYKQAVNVVVVDRKASTSYIQRRLSIGYNKAASLIEKMEKEGLIGPADHAGRRDIYLEKPEN